MKKFNFVIHRNRLLLAIIVSPFDIAFFTFLYVVKQTLFTCCLFKVEVNFEQLINNFGMNSSCCGDLKV